MRIKQDERFKADDVGALWRVYEMPERKENNPVYANTVQAAIRDLDLTSRKQQADILSALSAVRNEESAFQYALSYGFPLREHGSQGALRQITVLAKSVNFLHRISTAVINNDAATIEELAKVRRLRNSTAFDFRQGFPIYGQLAGSVSSGASYKIKHLDEQALRTTAPTSSKNLTALCAQRVLAQSLQICLSGVKPSMNRLLARKPDKSELVPLCPWQAAHVALYDLLLTGSGVKVCATCGDPVGKRQTYCGDTCSAYGRRHNLVPKREYKRT